MRVILCDNYEKMSDAGAKLIASQMILKPDCTLGLATGSTPIGVYERLVDMYKKGELDFSKVTTFNLDEYYPISKKDDQSYDYFMKQNLFSKVNVPAEKIHIPNGEATDPDAECENYDKMIAQNGGIDLQLLGIGVNGHIGFNEPEESLYAGTHCTGLTESTIKANSRFFADESMVPTKALTMGMASILSARRIIIMASGKNKHEAVSALLNDKITTAVPATLLKLHPDVVLICDKEAYYGK